MQNNNNIRNEQIKQASAKMLEGVRGISGGLSSFINSLTDKMSDEQKKEFHAEIKKHDINSSVNKIKDELNQFKNTYNI